LKKGWKKKPPLSSRTLINRFEGSYGTFGEGKPIIINDIGLVCPKIKINNHGVNVNIIILIYLKHIENIKTITIKYIYNESYIILFKK